MKWTTKYLFAASMLLLPATCKAQLAGKVECPRAEGYIYLYSSISTLDVRSTLKCGQQVQILNRYGAYFYVRASDGETGYVPFESLTLVKGKSDEQDPKAPGAATTPTIVYDPPAVKASSAPPAPSPEQTLNLLDGTPVHLKIGRTLSSADAHVGDEVDFQVAEDVVVNGHTVIAKGATAIGVVAEAAPKHIGRSGKLSLSLTYVRLTNEEKAGLRAFQDTKAEHRGDVVVPQGTDFTAFVNGAKRLNAANFSAAKEPPASQPAAGTSQP